MSHSPGSLLASPAPSDSSWGLVNQKLEQLIGLVQKQKGGDGIDERQDNLPESQDSQN